MPLTQKDIDELKEIYKAQFHEELSNDDAWEMGIRLINFFLLLLGDKTIAPPIDRLKHDK